MDYLPKPPAKIEVKLLLHPHDHNRALAMRRLTLEAVSTGTSAGLLSVMYDEARLRANEVRLRRPSERIKPYTSAAEKLGRWVARVPAPTVFSLLRVYP